MSYLLAEGGSGWNNGNTCHASAGGFYWQVSGIGFTKMINIAYIRSCCHHWPNAIMLMRVMQWVSAAVILYGECSNEAIQTAKHGTPLVFAPRCCTYYLCDDNFGSVPITLANASSLETQANCYVNIPEHRQPGHYSREEHLSSYAPDFMRRMDRC
jgi:hypothetical protein